jgi:ABC-2 type transport system permease protein
MSKIGIIIRREYLSRVKKRMFLLTTLGLPLLMVGFSFLTGYLANSTAEKLNMACSSIICGIVVVIKVLLTLMQES